MKTRFLLVTIGLLFTSGSIAVEQKGKPDRIWSGDSTTESVVPELADIVVLCATDEDKKFAKEWSIYVARKDLKGTELQKTINWVSNEAAIQRKKNRHKNGNESDDQAWKAERQKLMDEIARQARML